MRIKEVEDLTGLTRKAIRYYEEWTDSDCQGGKWI